MSLRDGLFSPLNRKVSQNALDSLNGLFTKIADDLSDWALNISMCFFGDYDNVSAFIAACGCYSH